MLNANEIVSYILISMVSSLIGWLVCYIRWHHRYGGTIMIGEEDGEPRVNLIIFEKYANNLEEYDSIELKIEKYSKPNMNQ